MHLFYTHRTTPSKQAEVHILSALEETQVQKGSPLPQIPQQVSSW